MSIFTERSKAKPKHIRMKNLANEENNFIKQKKFSLEDEIFETELEDYVSFIRRFETLAEMFKKSEDELIIKPVVKIAENEAKDENVDGVKDEIEEEKKKEVEDLKKLQELNNKKKKKFEEPLYVTLYDIARFRMAKFLMLCLTLGFLLSTFSYLTNRSLTNVEQQSQIRKVLSNSFLFNPLYKSTLEKDTIFMSLDSKNLIKNKRDLLVLLDIVLNNLLFEIEKNNSNGMNPKDNFDGYFQSTRTIYEILKGMRMVSISSTEVPNGQKSNITTIPFLGNNITNLLDMGKEYSDLTVFNKNQTLNLVGYNSNVYDQILVIKL